MYPVFLCVDVDRSFAESNNKTCLLNAPQTKRNCVWFN